MKVKSIIILGVILLALVGFGFLLAIGIGEGKVFNINNIRQGLDLMGGVSILYEADKEAPTADEMESAKTLIQGRLDRKNYTEAEVAIEGGNRLRVDIPGVDNAQEAISEIGATAMLYFAEIVEEGGYDPEKDIVFDGYDIYSQEMVIFRIVLTGEYVADARRQVYQQNQSSISEQVVALEFTSDGAYFFEEATGRNIGKPIYIFMDTDVLSAPTVNARISGGNAIITGSYDVAGAEELAASIRAGSLPFNLTNIYSRNVGAKLGAEALSTSIIAAIIGACLVVLFMLIIYKLLGVTADLALIIYVELVLMILSVFKITLTLPGIAGIILSVGMAVDATVIIFERIREETSAGKTLSASIDAGFKRAFPAIFDGNVTTLIAAAVLFSLGSGPVKGFAQTLAIGVIMSMFTALIVTKYILISFADIGIIKTKPNTKGKAKSEATGGISA